MRLILAQIGTNQTVALAVKEIVRLIKAMDKTIALDVRRYDEKKADVKNALWVGIDGSVEKSKDDHIAIKVKDAEGIITGSNERSVLIAAYRFMTELGCRFLRPGPAGEKIPEQPLDYADLTVDIDELPSYRHRGICIEGSVGYEHVINTIEWLPKVGMNSFYIQFFTPTTVFKRYYSKYYENEQDKDFGNNLTDADIDAMMELVKDEIQKRSLVLHAVGHGWSSAPYGFVATGWEKYEGEIDDKMRAALALYKGERKFFNDTPISTQLCYSNPGVMEHVTDFAVEYCRKNPHIHYLSFGMGDGGRNHCECEECIKKTPSDHYVDMLNLLDIKLEKAGLDTKITFSVYADTLFAPKQEKLRDSGRFCLKFAPIARSFSQSYDEIDLDNLPETAPFVLNQDMVRNTVELNVAYLEKWQRNYKGDAFVFDYHLMWDHDTDPGYYNVAKTINRDMASLGRIKLNGMLSCQLLRSSFPTGLPTYTMAKTLWNKKYTFEEIKNDYFTTAFGEDAKLAENYLSEISDLACPPFVRGNLKLSPEEVIERYTKLKEVVVSFRENHAQKMADVSPDWEHLYIHTFMIPIFADVYMARYRGDEETVQRHSDAFRACVQKYQPMIDDVCGDYHMKFTLLKKYLARHKPE